MGKERDNPWPLGLEHEDRERIAEATGGSRFMDSWPLALLLAEILACRRSIEARVETLVDRSRERR